MSWFLFIGRAKLNFTEKEIGRMTIRKFMKLYEHYKNYFDLEMKLRAGKTTYSELAKFQEKNGGDGEWF